MQLKFMRTLLDGTESPVFIDKFSSLDELKAADRKNSEAVLSVLRRTKRFSCFEATEYADLARTLTRLEKSGRMKTDNSCGYPWIDVVEIDGKRLNQK